MKRLTRKHHYTLANDLMRDFFPTWWHCIRRMFKTPSHRMCYGYVPLKDKIYVIRPHWFCECEQREAFEKFV